MPVLNAGDLGGVPVDPISPGGSVPCKFDFASKTNGTGATDWLRTGETIDSYTLTPASELAVTGQSIQDSNTSIQFVANPSDAIVEGHYTVECEVTTNSVPARTDLFTMIVPVYQK